MNWFCNRNQLPHIYQQLMKLIIPLSLHFKFEQYVGSKDGNRSQVGKYR